MKRSGLLCTVFCLCAAPVSAQQIDCETAEAQVELNACAEMEWQAADVELNQAYRSAKDWMREIDQGLPEEERGAEAFLRDGQRAWISFRDATCAAEGYVMHGGSAEPLLIYGCMARLTQQRAADLVALTEGY